jgi:hypothetical protein
MIGNNQSRFYLLLLFPIGIMLSDFAENLNSIHMLNNFPFIDDVSAKRGSFFSSLKWYLTIMTISLLLVAFIYSMILRIQKNKSINS